MARAIKGFYTGGHLILGYDNVKGELKINETEQELVYKIFMYYLKEPSTNTVSQRLNKEGYKTKTLITKKGDRKGGSLFTKQGVLRTLKNKTYLGLVPWKGEVYPGVHEAIIDQELFDAVQKRLDESKKDIQVTRKIKSPLTLLGITKCGLCGSNLTSSSAKKGNHYYYKCSKKIHSASNDCPAKDLPAIVLENCIKDLMISIVSDDEFYEAIYNQIKFNNEEEVHQLDKDLKGLRTNKTRAETEKTNILNAIKAGSKKIKLVEYELEKVENDLIVRSNLIITKERERDLTANQRISKIKLNKLLEDYINIYEGLVQEEKIRFNQLLFVDIISYFNKNDKDGRIEIKIRGDGKLEKSWNEIKNASQLTLVRTSDGFGSARDPMLQRSLVLKYPLLCEKRNTGRIKSISMLKSFPRNWLSQAA